MNTRKRYVATVEDKIALRKYKSGKSIGFTKVASLKAKGLLPRSSGMYILGPKYSGTGKERMLRSMRSKHNTRRVKDKYI
jgi:hypothetical protein